MLLVKLDVGADADDFKRPVNCLLKRDDPCPCKSANEHQEFAQEHVHNSAKFWPLNLKIG